VRSLRVLIRGPNLASTSCMKNAKEIIKEWPDDQRETTQVMIDQYGEPDEATSELLIWHNKGRWVEIVAYKEGTQHDFVFPHLDIIESVTAYHVPVDKLSEIEAFDGSVTVRRTQGLISARCHDEMANLLAIKLSHDIIQNKKTVEEARKAYVDIMVDYRAKRPTPYMDALQFPEQKNTADAVVTLITPEELQKRAGGVPARNGI
jgi:hypothetical protein